MHLIRRTVRAALCLAVAGVVVGGIAGCTAGAESEPDDSVDSTPSSSVAASGTAPMVFAFVCQDDGVPSRTETFTTYSAVWEAERTDCRAQRITGTEASAQQQDAVDATAGESTIEQLAATCAVSGAAPWTTPIESAAEARTAAGLAIYCPGHPEMKHLRDAIAAYRG
ncbi:hypothetical protein ACO0E1_14375 [Curtobacterium sp. RRHDQ66]|uniref:hypothetical protein n=1 Tax=Curtobacterium guangdongense TaxID=3413380 RepID=UPI003BF12294